MSRDCCAALIAVPRVYLQFVVVVFPDHSHFLFWIREDRIRHVRICLRNYYDALVALQSKKFLFEIKVSKYSNQRLQISKEEARIRNE